MAVEPAENLAFFWNLLGFSSWPQQIIKYNTYITFPVTFSGRHKTAATMLIDRTTAAMLIDRTSTMLIDIITIMQMDRTTATMLIDRTITTMLIDRTTTTMLIDRTKQQQC